MNIWHKCFYDKIYKLVILHNIALTQYWCIYNSQKRMNMRTSTNLNFNPDCLVFYFSYGLIYNYHFKNSSTLYCKYGACRTEFIFKWVHCSKKVHIIYNFCRFLSFNLAIREISSFQFKSARVALHEKCLYSEFFWCECGKIRTRKIPNVDTFHGVLVS